MLQTILIIVSTVAVYLLFQKLYVKVNHPLLLPVLTTTAAIILVLVVFQIPYDTYMEGGQWIQQMLGPGIVALAFPLYNQRTLIMKYKYSILISLAVSMISGLVSVFLLLKMLKLSDEYLLTALPKSLTSPVAMQISESIGGIAPMTVVLVMIAGFTGAFFGPLIFKWTKVDTAISRGVALGSASHGVGLSKLKDYGEEDLSVGSLSMGISAVMGAFICPIFALIFI